MQSQNKLQEWIVTKFQEKISWTTTKKWISQARHPKINNNKIRQIRKPEGLYCYYYSKNNYFKNQLFVRAKTNRNNVVYTVALQVMSVWKENSNRLGEMGGRIGSRNRSGLSWHVFVQHCWGKLLSLSRYSSISKPAKSGDLFSYQTSIFLPVY